MKHHSEERPSAALLWSVVLAVTAAFVFGTQDLLYSANAGRFTTVAELAERLEGGNLARRISFLGLGTLGFGLLVRRLRPFVMSATGVLLLVYVAWVGASVLWSDDPAKTARRFVLFACLVVAAIGMARTFSLRDLRGLVFGSAAAILILGLASEVALGNFTPWASTHRFSGTLHPNGQAVNSSLLVLAGVSITQDRRARFRVAVGVMVVLGLAGLLMTRSRTALAGCLVGLFILFAPERDRGSAGPIPLAIYTVFAATVTATLLFVNSAIPFLGDAVRLGRVNLSPAALSGRGPLWETLVPYALDRPVLGYGFDAFWTPTRLIEVALSSGWPMTTSHSIYYETFLGLGVVGLTLFLALAVALFVNTARLPRGPVRRALIAMIVFAALQGVLEASLFAPNILFLALLWLAAEFGFPQTSAQGERVVVPPGSDLQ